MNLPPINMISQQELCDHIEDEDFLLRYGNPVAIKADNGTVLVLMAIEYYERMTGKTFDIKEESITGKAMEYF